MSMRLTRIVNVIYLIQYVKISLVQFTLLQSIFVASQFIMEIPAGVIGDRFKRKTVVIIGLILSIIAQMLIGSKGLFCVDIQFFGLAVGFVLEGFGRAFISGADEALFFEELRMHGFKDQYDKIVGRNRLVVAVSLGAASFIGAILYEFYVPLPYIGQICMTIIAIGVILSIREQKVTQKTKKESSLKSMVQGMVTIRSETHVLFMLILLCLIAAVTNTLFGIMPDYISRVGFTPSQTGVVFLFLALISGVVAAQAYRFSKCSYGQLLLITGICIGAGVLCIYYGNSKIMVITGLTLLYIILDFLTPGAMKVFNFAVEDNIRATFLSSISFLSAAITMILYPLFGFGVQQMGMERLLLLVAIVIIILLSVSARFYKRLINK